MQKLPNSLDNHKVLKRIRKNLFNKAYSVLCDNYHKTTCETEHHISVCDYRLLHCVDTDIFKFIAELLFGLSGNFLANTNEISDKIVF